MFHISIWGTWCFVLGAEPTKALRGDGTAVKTLVSISCLKLNSILYKSQNREANEGSVHCADIEGIDVKPGSANCFGC